MGFIPALTDVPERPSWEPQGEQEKMADRAKSGRRGSEESQSQECGCKRRGCQQIRGCPQVRASLGVGVAGVIAGGKGYLGSAQPRAWGKRGLAPLPARSREINWRPTNLPELLACSKILLAESGSRLVIPALQSLRQEDQSSLPAQAPSLARLNHERLLLTRMEERKPEEEGCDKRRAGHDRRSSREGSGIRDGSEVIDVGMSCYPKRAAPQEEGERESDTSQAGCS